MNRAHFRPLPLAAALAAFALNLIFLHSRTAAPALCEKGSSADAATQREAAAQMQQQTYAPTPAPIQEAANVEPMRVAQREVVRMPGVGLVRVTAYEGDEETLLVFEDAATGEKLESFTTASGSHGPTLRFTLVHADGLPDPMVVGLAVSPGGSDSDWGATAFAAVGGELRRVTGFEALRAGDRGGFYFGDLGGGLGPGAAVWNDVWDLDYEGHPSPHRYEVKLYKWSRARKRFEWHRVFRTRGKFDSGEAALSSVGLYFTDVRLGVRDFEYLGE